MRVNGGEGHLSVVIGVFFVPYLYKSCGCFGGNDDDISV